MPRPLHGPPNRPPHRPGRRSAARLVAIAAATLAIVLPGLFGRAAAAPRPLRTPWREAGLTERQAAAHLLDRLTYGPRPGEIDRVVAMGVDRWLERQLAADLPEPELDRRLAGLPAVAMSAEELAATYPPPGAILREAQRDGVIPEGLDPRSLRDDDGSTEARRVRRDLRAWAARRGYRRQRELLEQLQVQKLYRAVWAENQLAELMTEFWFNHFNVSITALDARAAVLPYERDAIRPHALGSFGELLAATARHPAMLLYLDNARSVAEEGRPTTAGDQLDRLRGRVRRRGAGLRRGRGPAGRLTGLNENYARELLELHTLGVDGGYDQRDVVEVARAFTGWTVLPPGAGREEAERRLARLSRFGTAIGGLGFVVDGGFLFRADAHDAGVKTVLGTTLPAGRGIEDGEQVLELLAGHPSTARHLARKLAVRLVSDEPPEALVDRLAARWTATGGDLRAVLRALVESPELWAPEARAAKIKSPLELAASALRGLDAELVEPRTAIEWIARMGQPLYAYQAPSGYPDRAEHWVNTGSLLNRMNFGLQLAAGRISGVRVDPAALDGGREPESQQAALAAYAALLMPERDLDAALARLAPVVGRSGLAERVEAAAPRPEIPSFVDGEEAAMFDGERRPPAAERPAASRYGGPPPSAQVVGVILGSPEFQRR